MDDDHLEPGEHEDHLDAHVIRRLVALCVMTVLAATLMSPARAQEPLRSGTITGWGFTFFAMFNGEARDCQWSEWEIEGTRGANPECRVWLDSGCDPALAGRDPAVSASIQDVSALADGATTRTFEWGSDTSGWGGVVVQLWAADCTEIEQAKWRSRESPCCWSNARGTTFAIPPDARWMTVTTNDNHKVEWTLT